jgi:hypothetical protein
MEETDVVANGVETGEEAVAAAEDAGATIVEGG